MLKVGVMGCASIAQRAMIPAILECENTALVAVASRTQEKAEEFAQHFDCDALVGYDALLERDDIDAVYMPLPTGLHSQWVTEALDAGKHILVEKSFAENFASAERMLNLAREKNLLVVENYLFVHHAQHRWVQDFIAEGNLGGIHLFRSTFGFPPLPRENFRYDKRLGGGALLDAGGYVIKAAQAFLGPDVSLVGAVLRYDAELGVDLYGEAMLKNPAGQVAQVAFGFNYFYQCNYEILGTQGKLTVERAFTPPPGFQPIVHFERQGEKEEFVLPPDNHYRNMFDFFSAAVETPDTYNIHWDELLLQARLLDEIRKKGDA